MSGFEIVSLKEWWKGVSTNKDVVVNRLPIVDVRETQTHRLSTNETTIVHLPLDTLQSGERSCELPPRHVSFCLLMDTSQNLETVMAFFGATSSRATQQSRKPWLVPQVLLANDALWEDAKELGLLQSKSTNESNDCFVPLQRLWQPDPMVQHVLWPLLREQLLTSQRERQVWDLGSGAGRDVCFLAEQSKALRIPSHFVGIDHHKASAKRCLPFWKHRHVDDYTSSLHLDVSKISLLEEKMVKINVVCLYAVRFWNPKLVTWIANEAPLEAGTLFGMSHFCKPHPGASWDFDHPKEKSVLERNDLRDLFQESNQWQVLHDELAPDGDHGRTLIQFVAKRLVDKRRMKLRS